mmetsp:Transcript_112476/g.324946  ORF Transcript_112476/g.324946 Transcript_112476/m.324946 type:complete len:246 (+) Transcript_112476:141-878(+)
MALFMPSMQAILRPDWARDPCAIFDDVYASTPLEWGAPPWKRPRLGELGIGSSGLDWRPSSSAGATCRRQSPSLAGAPLRLPMDRDPVAVARDAEAALISSPCTGTLQPSSGVSSASPLQVVSTAGPMSAAVAPVGSARVPTSHCATARVGMPTGLELPEPEARWPDPLAPGMSSSDTMHAGSMAIVQFLGLDDALRRGTGSLDYRGEAAEVSSRRGSEDASDDEGEELIMDEIESEARVAMDCS